MLLRPVHVICNEINLLKFACLLVHGVIVVTSFTVAVLVASSLRRGCVIIGHFVVLSSRRRTSISSSSLTRHRRVVIVSSWSPRGRGRVAPWLCRGRAHRRGRVVAASWSRYGRSCVLVTSSWSRRTCSRRSLRVVSRYRRIIVASSLADTSLTRNRRVGVASSLKRRRRVAVFASSLIRSRCVLIFDASSSRRDRVVVASLSRRSRFVVALSLRCRCWSCRRLHVVVVAPSPERCRVVFASLIFASSQSSRCVFVASSSYFYELNAIDSTQLCDLVIIIMITL